MIYCKQIWNCEEPITNVEIIPENFAGQEITENIR